MRSKFKWIFTLLVALTMQFSFAQQKTVTGTVLSDGAALPGASVMIKGTQQGTTTDANGKYSIKAKEGDVLEVTYVGKPSQSSTVGASNVVNFTLAGDVKIEDVIVTAVGQKRKKDAITYSYSQVKKDELTQASAPNAVIALTGKVSGLQINTTSSSVNSSTRIVLNGNRSVTGNNQALVVIDNVISTAGILQSLPPDVIENMNVLKGLQGAALYGEDGRNGVIIVTTKKGTSKGGKLDVNFKSSLDFQEVAYLPERQTRYGQGWFGEHIAIENGAWGAEMNGAMMPTGLPQADGSYVMAPYTGDSNNIKDFFQNGAVRQNTLTVSGGSIDNGYALFSIGRLENDFVVKGDELKRTNFLFKAGKKIGKLTVDGNVNYFQTKTSNTNAGLYSELLQTATNIPVSAFANSGNNGHWTVYYKNPYWMRENARNNAVADVFVTQASLNYELNKNINVSWRGNVRGTSTGTTNYQNEFSKEDDIYNATANRIVISNYFTSSSFQRNIYSDLLVNFDYDLTNDLNFKALLGNNIQDNYFKINQVGGNELGSIEGFYNYQNVLEPALANQLSNFYQRDRRFSFFGSADFDYKNFLFLNLTARNDWTSTLSPNTRSVFYPSAGLSFVPTVAFDGLKSNALNYAKLYTSWTRTGNSSFVGAYTIDQIGVGAPGYAFGDLQSYIINAAGVNPYIKPEIITNFDFGVNLGLFKDRVTLDAQYYITKTADLATRVTASSTSGFTSLLDNVGNLETKGFNIDLGFTPIKGNFTWDIKANLTHYKTIVTSLQDGAEEVNLQSNALVGIFAVVGEEFPSIKGIGYQRDPNGNVIIDASTGMPKYSSEFINLGKATPDYIIGLTNNLSYKNLKLSAVMDYRTGHDFVSLTRAQLAWSGHLIESAENGRNGGFVFPNSVIETSPGVYTANTNVVTGGTSYQSFQTFYEEDNNGSNFENNVLDATAFKVRELALSYSLGKKALQHTKLSSVTFGVNARNPFMFLAKENRYYADPESSNTNGNAQGISPVGNYPLVRTYGFSVNLTF